MISATTSSVIARAPDVVFAFVADQTNAPLWQADLAEVRRIGNDALGVGTQHIFVRQFAGRRIEARNRFTRYEPPRFVEFEVTDGWMVGRAAYRVDPHEAGCVLTSQMDFRLRGVARILEPLLRRQLAADSRRDAVALTDLLESEQMNG